ncbi:MAG TPA: hypothetical protein VLL52_12640 [Anaerolineae bacterium]|nr:hypothetical protein [Anaerolineae bacterium]
MLFTTLVSAAINKYLVDYIRFVFVDAATGDDKRANTILIKFISSAVGVLVWFVVRYVLYREDCEVSADEVFHAVTVGTISNYLHDADGVLRQAAIRLKKVNQN